MLNVYAAVFVLQLPREPTNWQGFVDTVCSMALIVIAFWAGLRSVRILTLFLGKLTAKTKSPLDDRLVPFIDKVMRAVVVIMGVLMVLQQAGVKITSILAGLGIGGLAIALAAKDMLANIFGTITIVGDYPFDVGDWIKTPDVEGTVEDIGFRSTKVRTFGNSLVSVPNAKLAGSAIENFSRMFKRRISFRISVTYETTPAQMREAVASLRDVLRNRDDIRQDFWLVYFTDFADSAMQIMVYCFTKTTVWGTSSRCASSSTSRWWRRCRPSAWSSPSPRGRCTCGRTTRTSARSSRIGAPRCCRSAKIARPTTAPPAPPPWPGARPRTADPAAADPERLDNSVIAHYLVWFATARRFVCDVECHRGPSYR